MRASNNSNDDDNSNDHEPIGNIVTLAQEKQVFSYKIIFISWNRMVESCKNARNATTQILLLLTLSAIS